MARRARGRRFHVWLVVMLLVVVVVAGGVAAQLVRPVPRPAPEVAIPASLERVPDPPGGPLPWPSVGAAAITVPGVVTFPPVGTTAAVPIASITKVMTTLVLLHDHPLAPGGPGPAIP